MSSQFLAKLEEEKKQAQQGKPIDAEMVEENEDDEEENDAVADLNVQDGVGAMHLENSKNVPIKATHNFHAPKPVAPKPA